MNDEQTVLRALIMEALMREMEGLGWGWMWMWMVGLW